MSERQQDTRPLASRRAGADTSPIPAGAEQATTVLPALPAQRAGRDVLADAQARQRERFGGAKIGAAFFGWLVAVGMTVLLTVVAVGVGAAIGATTRLDPAGTDATAIGVTGAVVLLVVLALAYFAGGYVAGRLARFDGTRNGVLAWVVGIVVTIVVAVAGAAIGAGYGLATRVSLPAVPGNVQALTVSGIVALVVVLLVTVLAAAAGGRMGERFHRRLERKTAKEF